MDRKRISVFTDKEKKLLPPPGMEAINKRRNCMKTRNSRGSVLVIGIILLLIQSPTAGCEEMGAGLPRRIDIGPTLYLQEVTDGIWIHTSEIRMEPWGMVPANGMAVFTDKTLFIIDTPWRDEQTRDLVRWFENRYQVHEVQVIVCHYHQDNLGGLNWVHQQGIPSYALERTRRICRRKGLPVPQYGLDKLHSFDSVGIPFELFFPGEGHTVDSVCIYFPDQRVLFGGCSVKAHSNRTLGNTADANLQAWPESLRTMKARYPQAALVVPGHGAPGDLSLIDHTLSLFP